MPYFISNEYNTHAEMNFQKNLLKHSFETCIKYFII